MPTGVRTADTDLSLEAVVQLAGSSDMDADSSVVVVVADPDVGRGCSALPRPASDSYLRCLLCRVGADCTDPDASLEQNVAGVVDTEYPLEVPQACWDLVEGTGQDLGYLRLARLRWGAGSGNRAAGGTAATAWLDGVRPASDTPEVGSCPLWSTGVFQLRSCLLASRGPPPYAPLSIRRRCG